MGRRWRPAVVALGALAAGLGATPGGSRQGGEISTMQKDDGYRGIWFDLGQYSDHGPKYSGGLGTYTAKHIPLAVYAPQANKTFFVYGGAKEGRRQLLIMASYFDHERGRVPRPTVVHDKQGVDDPHDNASMALDEHGHVWVFVSGRGRARPGFKYRGTQPYSIDAFERISEEEMTYPQPWWIAGAGFIHLFTRYTAGRELYWNTSPDGRRWSEPRRLAGMGGHYQVSCARGRRVVTAFNMHPGGNVDLRTNLYVVQTEDLGATWRTVDGRTVEPPLVDMRGPALVRDFQAEGRLVYLKDINVDADGNPVVLVVTSSHALAGPRGDPRIWTVLHWTGNGWRLHEVTASTHNYDMGSLYIEIDAGGREVWRVIGPTEPGPQRWGAGGEMALWISRDRGGAWTRERAITRDSPLNHTYARRPVNAHPDFYAFWADGHPDQETPSHLYFTNRDGSVVRRLPYDMEGEFAVPEIVAGPRGPSAREGSAHR